MTLTKCCQFYMFSDSLFYRKETEFIVYVLISRFLIKIVSSEFKINNNQYQIHQDLRWSTCSKYSWDKGDTESKNFFINRFDGLVQCLFVAT